MIVLRFLNLLAGFEEDGKLVLDLNRSRLAGMRWYNVLVIRNQKKHTPRFSIITSIFDFFLEFIGIRHCSYITVILWS